MFVFVMTVFAASNIRGWNYRLVKDVNDLQCCLGLYFSNICIFILYQSQFYIYIILYSVV